VVRLGLSRQTWSDPADIKHLAQEVARRRPGEQPGRSVLGSDRGPEHCGLRFYVASNVRALPACRCVCTGHAERGTGSIINISSMPAALACRRVQRTGATKAALDSMTEAGRRVSPRGVRVNAVLLDPSYPG